MEHQWQERKRPIRLERRYEFDTYDSLREFLDAAAEISEKEDLYPDMGFGKNYVNATIHVDEGEEELAEKHHNLAIAFDTLHSNHTS